MTNPVSNHDMKVFTGLSNPELSKRLGRYCGVTVSSAEFSLYNNGDAFTWDTSCWYCRRIWCGHPRLGAGEERVHRAEQRQRHQQPPDGIASLRPGAVSTVRVVALAHEIFPGSNFIRIYEISARAGFDFIISQGWRKLMYLETRYEYAYHGIKLSHLIGV